MAIQEHTPVGEIAAGSLAAVGVLEKYGIDYCCGGKRSLEDACREKGLAAAGLRSEIEQAGRAPWPSESVDWNAAPLASLIQHIVAAHHDYLRVELPRIAQRLAKVVQVHGAKDPAALNELQAVYQGLWQELDMHMRKEEGMLFPAISRYEAAVESGLPLPPSPFGAIANPIAVMEAEHESAGSALRRMRELTRDYQLPEHGCATYRAMLEGLRALESDLHRHIHLENNILFPRAIALETANR